MSESWQICRLDGTTWDLKDLRSFSSEQQAIVTLTLETGLVLHGREEPNGSWHVVDVKTGNTIAAVRRTEEHPATPVGGDVEGTPGPLKRWHGLTWVGWLNFLVLRWFLVRLWYRIEEDDGTISSYFFKFTPTWRW